MRTYPAHDVAANLVGFIGTDGPLGGARADASTRCCAGKDGSETYEVGGGNRIPLGDNSTVTARSTAQDLHTTIDRDLQWYTQRVLRQAVQGARGDSGLRGRHGLPHRRDPLARRLPDVRRRPTRGLADRSDLRLAGADATVYEPGSVEKVLTLSSLIDAGKVTAAHRLIVPGAAARAATG